MPAMATPLACPFACAMTDASRSGRGRLSDPVLQDAVNRTNAVLPTDLFPLLVRAPVIAHRHLVDAKVHLGKLGGQLGLDAESVFLDLYRLDHVRPEGLVAGL